MRRANALAILVALLCATTTANAASDVADAAMRGDHASLRRWLDAQLDVNAAQPDGATALHWAAYRGDPVAASMLLEAGANVGAANREGARRCRWRASPVTPKSSPCCSTRGPRRTNGSRTVKPRS
jgi:ankyrin repeat protein